MKMWYKCDGGGEGMGEGEGKGEGKGVCEYEEQFKARGSHQV